MQQAIQGGDATGGDPIVSTSSGQVRGVRLGGVNRFFAIPYAAAPVGPHRFAEPQPHPGWTGLRDAAERGATAPQIVTPPPELDIAAFIGDGWRAGDEYLTVNVWAPEAAPEPAPVIVFIHGGGFVNGAGDPPAFDGSSFARNGVVCVTLNYRLGIEGFLVLEGAPTNLGLRDQVAALNWVRAEIAGFGGDPERVTVFGESAGAMSIGCLVGSPLAKGLFSRAIIQSGHGRMVRSKEVAARVTTALAERLGIPATVEGFSTLSPQASADAVQAISLVGAGLDLREADGIDPSYGLSRFLPIWGDDVVPLPPHDAAAKGAGRDVELLVGSNTEEMNLYFVPPSLDVTGDAPTVTAMLAAVAPDAAVLLDAYGLSDAEAKPGEVLGRAMSDAIFRQSARDYAAVHPGDAHVYEFAWRSPAYGERLGACHALELPFVFNTLQTCAGPRGLLGAEPPQALADLMHGVWLAFAKGEPLNWPSYDAETRWSFSLPDGKAVQEAPTPLARLRATAKAA